jgi:cell division protein FtsB
MRWLPWILAGLLLYLQADLWFGKGNLPYVMGLQRQLDQQLAGNERLRERNRQALAEVNDLREGLEMVEERARAELGMLRPNELLVQVTRPVQATAAATQPAAPGR